MNFKELELYKMQYELDKQYIQKLETKNHELTEEVHHLKELLLSLSDHVQTKGV